MPCQCPECQKINYNAGLSFLETRRKHIAEKDKSCMIDLNESDFIFPCLLPIGAVGPNQMVGGNGIILNLFPGESDKINKMFTNAIIGNSLPKNGPTT